MWRSGDPTAELFHLLQPIRSAAPFVETLVRTALGTNRDETGSGSISLSPINAAVGDVIFICVGVEDPGDGSGLPDTPTIGLDSFTNEDYALTGTGGFLMARYVVPVALVGETIIVNLPSFPSFSLIIGCKVSGLKAAPADIVGSSDGSGVGTVATSNLTGNTAQAHELLLGWIGTTGRGSDAAGVWANGFTAGQRIGTTAVHMAIYEGYRFVNAIGSYQMQCGSMTNRGWHCLTNTYKAA